MGEVHNWRTCRCALCLTCQRLLLLVYNERLGEEFSRSCVSKLRGVYLELLDEAEGRSREGVGRATYSTPAFAEGRAGTATPTRATDTKDKEESKPKPSRPEPKVKGEPSEEGKEESAASEQPEEETSTASGLREGVVRNTPGDAGARSPSKRRRRSRSRRRRQRSSEKKSARKDRSTSRGRRRHSRSHAEVEGGPKEARTVERLPERKGTARDPSEPATTPQAESNQSRPPVPRPSRFDPVARRAAPPPSVRGSSRDRNEGERKERDRVLPRKKPQEPDHPPPGFRDNSGWVEYQAFPKSQGSSGYRYWPGGYRGRQPTESKGRTKREKNLNYRLWSEYDRQQERR